MSKDFVHREKIIETLPEFSKGFSFMIQKDYEELPTEPYLDKHRRLKPDHSEVPAEALDKLPVLYTLRKELKQTPVENQSDGTIPWYPQVQWEMTTTLDEDDWPNRILSITTKRPPARLDTTERDPTLRRLIAHHMPGTSRSP